MHTLLWCIPNPSLLNMLVTTAYLFTRATFWMRQSTLMDLTCECVCVCVCVCVLRSRHREMHDRFMKLYSVRAHIHHYTSLIDVDFISEVRRRSVHCRER